MNEQKRLLLMILNRLEVAYKYKCIGTHDVYFCRYAGATFSIFTNGQSVSMNKYLGTYSLDQQNTIFCLAESVKQKGYNIVLVNDNGEKHIGLNMICSSQPDRIQNFFTNFCYFIQFLQVKEDDF